MFYVCELKKDLFLNLADSLSWIISSDFPIEQYVLVNILRPEIIHFYGSCQNRNTVYKWQRLYCDMCHWTQELTDNVMGKYDWQWWVCSLTFGQYELHYFVKMVNIVYGYWCYSVYYYYNVYCIRLRFWWRCCLCSSSSSTPTSLWSLHIHFYFMCITLASENIEKKLHWPLSAGSQKGPRRLHNMHYCFSLQHFPTH